MSSTSQHNSAVTLRHFGNSATHLEGGCALGLDDRLVVRDCREKTFMSDEKKVTSAIRRTANHLP